MSDLMTDTEESTNIQSKAKKPTLINVSVSSDTGHPFQGRWGDGALDDPDDEPPGALVCGWYGG